MLLLFSDSIHERKNQIIFVFTICIVITLTYFPVLQNGFLTNWDDQWMVLNNPYLREANIETVYAIFTQSYGKQYSPINTLLYLFIQTLWTDNALSFHLLSVIFHLANFLLVGVFVNKLLEIVKGVHIPKTTRFYIAWGTAFFFCYSPFTS